MPKHLFERSEFLIATCKKKKLTVCVYVRLILVLVLGRQIVYGQNTVYLCLSKYIVFKNTHAHRNCGQLRANRQREATGRLQETTQATDARCVCASVLGCVYASVYPSCARWLLAKKFGCKRVFAASSSCITQPTASYNVRLNITDTTSQACGGKTACCCGSAGRKGSRQSEANERGCCEAQRPGEF